MSDSAGVHSLVIHRSAPPLHVISFDYYIEPGATVQCIGMFNTELGQYYAITVYNLPHILPDSGRTYTPEQSLARTAGVPDFRFSERQATPELPPAMMSPTFLKPSPDTSTFYVSSTVMTAYRHIYVDDTHDQLLELEIPVGTIVSVLPDCLKVSCVIPRRLYDYEDGVLREQEYEWCAHAKPATFRYIKGVRTYPDKYIDPFEFTSGLYCCATIADLVSWGCSNFRLIGDYRILGCL
jgi:hypothetical protein